ncbi:MAG TPA: TetR/AcrR family transcriptional regulator [Stellaceae bacterium]
MARTRKISEPKPARAAPLTRDTIVGAAKAVLERDGYDALTMRAVASELGVRAASLYWHVRDKDLLEDWLFGALLDEVTLTVRGADWREDVRAIARQMRGHLMSKRDMQRVSAGRFVLGPPLLRQMEIILGVLRRGGLSNRDAAFGIYTLLNYVNGFVLFQTAPLSAAQAKGAKRGVVFAGLRRQLAALPAATYPNSVALAGDLTSNDPDARFEFGLDLLIEGLERRAKPSHADAWRPASEGLNQES